MGSGGRAVKRRRSLALRRRAARLRAGASLRALRTAIGTAAALVLAFSLGGGLGSWLGGGSRAVGIEDTSDAGLTIEALLASAPAVMPARPGIALIIDDLGLDVAATRRAMALPAAVALAFLPYGAAAPALAAEAASGGHEVLVHLPMAPDGAVADPGPNALLDGLSVAELRRRLDANLDGLTGYDGVNNHMGSGLTRDGAAMAVVMAELARRGVFFVDSKTSAQTVAWREAERAGVPWSIRDVFLDDEPGIWAVEVQLQQLEAAARRDGFAVGIGHPYPSTLKALDVWLRGLSARGFDLVPVARTLRHPSPAVAEAQ